MPRLLVAAHGTRSAAGSATTRALVAAIATQRPSVPVSLCFLDVTAPSLAVALDRLGNEPVVVVPLLLAAGYHVTTDIPDVVAGRRSVRVARHLGPDPLVISAVADRLAAASGPAGLGESPVQLAAVASSRPSADTEVGRAAQLLSSRLGVPVEVLALPSGLDSVAPGPVAVYLLAEGGFWTRLQSAVRGVLADPIGAHPAVVSLVWDRYEEAVAESTA